jgi:hypothetical protein
MRVADRVLPIVLLALVSAVPAPAQRTWTVDAANGPGTDFVDLPAALAAAVHGDTILVRKGLYTPGNTDQGVTILGVDGALFDTGPNASVATFRVTGLPAGRTFVMKRMGNSAPNSMPQISSRDPLLWLIDNAGRIHLEGVTLDSQPWLHSAGVPALAVDRCRAVSVTGCTLSGAPAVQCVGSRLSICSSILAGNRAASMWAPFSAWPSAFGLAASSDSISDSIVTVARSVVRGGDGFEMLLRGWVGGSPAAYFLGGEATIAGDAASTCTAGLGWHAAPVPALEATSADLVLDPTAKFVAQVGAPLISGTPKSLTWRRVPALEASGAPPGSRVTTDLYSEPGHLAVLLAGQPGDPLLLAFGRLWLDPAVSLIVDVGFQGASQHRSVTIPIPSDPVLRGAPIGLQAVSGDAQAFALALSTPAIVVLD